VKRIAFVVTGTLLVLAAWNLSVLVPNMIGQKYAIGVDYRFFVESAQRWLNGVDPYLPETLTGRWEIIPDVQFLYPPIALFLFAPFVFLPAIFWWAIPAGMITYALARLRPAWWTWPYLAFVLWYPRTEAMFFFGSTTLWVLAFLALATVHAWAAPLVLFKPSIAPFALFQVRSRSWWAGFALVVALSVAVLPLSIEYVRAMMNLRGSALFALQEVPILFAPIVAFAGRGGAEANVIPVRMESLLNSVIRTFESRRRVMDASSTKTG
jgi:hypothetical protein